MVFGGSDVNIIIRARDMFSRTFTKAKIGLESFKKSAMGLGMVGIGIGMFGVKASEAANKVEKGFRNINSIMPGTYNSQKILGKEVKKNTLLLGDMGDETTVLEGYYQTMSAGWIKSADTLNVMNAATKAAVAGQVKLPDVILLISKTLHSYGMSTKEATKVTDIFQATVNTGITTWPELAHSFPLIAGTAASMKIPIREAAGTLAFLTKTMGNTDEATTALNSVMAGFTTPSKGMIAAVKKIGYTSAIAMVQQNGLGEIGRAHV